MMIQLDYLGNRLLILLMLNKQIKVPNIITKRLPPWDSLKINP